MPRYIVCLKRDGKKRFCEWSTVVDAPVTYLLTEAQFREYYEAEYGKAGQADLDARIERAKTNGTSALDGTTAEELARGNRAGKDEKPLPFDELWDEFLR
jgi:hypothetical protein